MMSRAAASLTASLLVGVLFLAYSGVVSAGHLQDTAPRANLLGNCDFAIVFGDFIVEGTGAIEIPADTAFWVGHGWGTDVPWKDLSRGDQKAFMSQATVFELDVDGELQQVSERRVFTEDFVLEDGTVIEDTRVKLFFYDFNEGMPAGPHTFTGMWYFDASDSFFGMFGSGVYKDRVPVTRCIIDITFTS